MCVEEELWVESPIQLSEPGRVPEHILGLLLDESEQTAHKWLVHSHFQELLLPFERISVTL